MHDLLALLHQQAFGIGVGRYPALGVTDEHEIAEPRQFIARIDDFTRRRSAHLDARLGGDVEPVILLTSAVLAVGFKDPARDRPDEARARAEVCRARLPGRRSPKNSRNSAGLGSVPMTSR